SLPFVKEKETLIRVKTFESRQATPLASMRSGRDETNSPDPANTRQEHHYGLRRRIHHRSPEEQQGKVYGARQKRRQRIHGARRDAGPGMLGRRRARRQSDRLSPRRAGEGRRSSRVLVDRMAGQEDPGHRHVEDGRSHEERSAHEPR